MPPPFDFNCSFPAPKAATLPAKLTPLAERRLAKSAHPWIYSKSIQKIKAGGKPGDVVILFRQRDNQVFGVGLYDPDTPIPIKMLHYHGRQTIDPAFFLAKIKAAWALRRPLRDANRTNAYRLVYGENDGLPGLIADLYDRVLVVKLYSLIWLPHLEAILQGLAETSGCSVVVLRLSRQLQKSDNFGFHDGQVLLGQLAHEDVEFEEYGVRFKANVIKGHKTGFFLDHRENRHKVGLLAAGKTLLDVFSYAGGFAVHALAQGATEATCLDISRQALELAQQNAALNPHTGRLTTIAGDAFSVFDDLVAHGKQYDIVVIDPPSFAKSNDEVRRALKKYAQLAETGRALTRSGGVLVLASCSSRVTADDFFGTVEPALGIPEGRFTVIEKTYHAVDHPVGFVEGAYLKCGYYRKAR